MMGKAALECVSRSHLWEKRNIILVPTVRCCHEWRMASFQGVCCNVFNNDLPRRYRVSFGGVLGL